MLTLIAKESGLLRGLSRRAFVVCDPVRSVTTSTVTLEDRISLDEAVPANPKSKLITGIRKTLFATRECTYALRQMDIPWDTSDTKAVEKFALDYQAVRVKAGLPPVGRAILKGLLLERRQAGGNVRKWVESVFSECRDTMDPETRVFYNKYLAKIDEIEAKTGKPLDNDNPEGLKMWQAAGKGWRKEAKITPEKIRDTFVNIYKNWIDDTRTQITAEYERVAKLFGIKEPVDFKKHYATFLKQMRASGGKRTI